MRILLVKDNQADVELTLHALRDDKLANKISVAHDGEEALDFLFCRGDHAGRSPLRSRLRDTLVFLNAHNAGPYVVSLSVGQARYDPGLPCSIGELFSRADALLYADKFSWRSGAIPTARTGLRKESMTRAARKGA